MSLKSSLLALAENIGMCQENARSIKQALAGGLTKCGAAEVNPWTLVKKETGAVAIDLPEAFTELLIIVDVSNHSSCINIPAVVLGETEISFYGGGYATASNCFESIVKVSATKATLNTAYFNGSSLLSTATCAVYAR